MSNQWGNEEFSWSSQPEREPPADPSWLKFEDAKGREVPLEWFNDIPYRPRESVWVDGKLTKRQYWIVNLVGWTIIILAVIGVLSLL